MFETVRARFRGRSGPARPPRPRRLGVERLEARDVPAWAVSPLATFPGEVTAPRQPDWVQMHVQPAGADRVLLTFESAAANESAFRPGRLAMFAGTGARAGSPGQASGPGFTLREVSAGPFFARVAAAGTATGAFAVSVGLAGDVTGDQRVDGQDLDLIRSLHGRRAGQDGFVPAADVNHNGVIGPGDVALARRNLGKAAVVGPLTADHVFLAGSDALGLKASPANPATQPRITLVIPDLAGATINPSSFSWGIQAVTDGGGGGTGKPIKTDLAVTMKTGPASPLLFDAVVQGRRLRDATLYVGRRGGTPGGSPVLRWDMADILISSYQTGGTGGANGVSLAETATLNFAKLQITFWPTLPNGQAGDPVQKGWDFVLSRPWDGPPA